MPAPDSASEVATSETAAPETAGEAVEGTSPLRRVGLLAGLGSALVVSLTPVPEGLAPAAWMTAAVALLMAVWWMTEAVPIAATSLLPLLLFPLMDVLPVREAAAPFANPLIFLFLGGFLLAQGLERWRLHRRLALLTVRAVGTRPSRVVAGFMLASAFSSMWISNTATAMMMMPIGLSVVGLVRKEPRKGSPGDDRVGRHFGLCLMLGIAYACSVGGLATLIGTPTNALLAGYLLESGGPEISFLGWLGLGLPATALGLVVVYAVLVRWVYPLRIRELPGGDALIRRQLAALGPITRAEKGVAVVFALTALLWITRPLLSGLVPGLSDAGVAIFGALLLFVLPLGDGGRPLLGAGAFRRLPFHVLLLFGGGLSLATAIQRSGLAEWIGGRMAGLGAWPPLLVVLVVVVVIVLLTELTSNTATAAAFLPVLGGMAPALGLAPLQLLAPAALGASCAFMLPVATPPNAIVYGSGHVTIPEMVRAGVWLNLLFAGLVTVLGYFLVPWVLG